jgi:hypothetical protein
VGDVDGKCKSCGGSHSSSGNSQVWDPKDLPEEPAVGAKLKKWKQKAKFSVLKDLKLEDLIIDIKKLKKSPSILSVPYSHTHTAGIRG